MEQLIKPNEYALEMGLEKQDVYKYIKEGILVGKILNGVMYVVVDDSELEEDSSATVKSQDNIDDVLAAKDETIVTLKESIETLKESNSEITTTLKSEIELLKNAFWEMKTVYSNRLENLVDKEESVDTVVKKKKWIGLKKLFKTYKIDGSKKRDKVKKRVQKAYLNRDKRVKLVNNRLKVNISMDIDKFIQ